jgi:hypothetical protein
MRLILAVTPFYQAVRLHGTHRHTTTRAFQFAQLLKPVAIHALK